MQRGKLSPLGQRRQRIGRKVMTISTITTSLERRGLRVITNPSQPRHFPSLHYSFKRWHGVTALCVVVVLVGVTFAVSALRSQQLAAEKVATAKAEANARIQLQKRQVCIAQVTAQHKDQLGKLTYDQLYGTQCR